MPLGCSFFLRTFFRYSSSSFPKSIPYGYSEELEYVRDLGKVPYRSGDQTFDQIADYLYAAALSYDRLAKEFYPRYQSRSKAFFAIWDCYEASRPSF